MKTFKVLMYGIEGFDKTYTWEDVDDPIPAVNFAEGLVEGLEIANGITASHPLSMGTHGFRWRFERGEYAGLIIKVVNEQGEVVTAKDY